MFVARLLYTIQDAVAGRLIGSMGRMWLAGGSLLFIPGV